MKRLIISVSFLFCSYICFSQINVACTNFTSEGKKWQTGTGLRKVFESAISKSKLRFKLIERSDDISLFFEKLQEEKNIYKDLFEDFSKKPELAGIDYLVVGNITSNVSTGKFSLNINFLKLTGKDATMKLPLLIILTKDQILDDSQTESVFVTELNSFADNFALAIKNQTDLTKLPDIYKRFEKSDSIISSLNNSVTQLQKFNEEKDKKIIKLDADISNLKEYTNIAPLNIWGLTMDPGGTIFETSAISEIMKNVWDFNLQTRTYTLRLTDSSLMFSDIASKQFPNFPFGHYSKATIRLARNGNDPEGMIALLKARQILEITTTIYGHHPSHDQVLSDIKKMLNIYDHH
jgi:hypothetical protein